MITSLYFVWVIDDTKCIYVTRVCLSVSLSVCVCVSVSVRLHMPTLLHGPGCNLGKWQEVPPSCALLGGFAIGARVRCYENIAWMRNVSEYLYSLYAWLLLDQIFVPPNNYCQSIEGNTKTNPNQWSDLNFSSSNQTPNGREHFSLRRQCPLSLIPRGSLSEQWMRRTQGELADLGLPGKRAI